MTDIRPGDRLIVALDVPTDTKALELVDELDQHASFFKVGLELFSSGSGVDLITQLVNRGHQVFADFKFFDLPETVYRAVRNLNGLGISFLTVHGDPQIMQAAVEAAEGISVLAVTVLTSMDDSSLDAMGVGMDMTELVQLRALGAQSAGCAGVIASGREAELIRKQVEKNFLIVTPGIRSPDAPADDQKRTVSVAQALKAGADYLVVGRPIRNAPNPQRATAAFQSEILKTLAEN